MAKTHQRVFALIAAVLFLATSVATGVAVVWQIRKDNEQAKTASNTPTAGDLNTQDTTTNPPEETNMLQGTKLTGFTPASTVSELQIIDLEVGAGEVVPEGATITAHYTGALVADGTIFQSSLDSGQPVQFSLDGVIEGWTKGVPGMKVGGTRRLVIPYAQAYGEAGRPDGGIPAKADLVFDIKLVSMP